MAWIVPLAAASLVATQGEFAVLSASQGTLDPQVEIMSLRAELAAVKAELKAAQSKPTAQGSVDMPHRGSLLREEWNAFDEKLEVRLSSQAKASNDEIGDDPVQTTLATALGEFHVFPALAGAFKLNLFETLHQSNFTFRSLQRGLNVSSKGLDALLAVFLPMDLIRYNLTTTTFANHPTLDSMMETNEWEEFRTWILGYAVSTQRQFYYVAESVREGKAEGLTQVLGDFPSLYEARAKLPEVARYWDPFMQLFDVANMMTRIRGTLYGPLLAALTAARATRNSSAELMSTQNSSLRFNGKMLDWCGNIGMNAVHLAEADPTLSITVLDLPEQCAKAADNIRMAGLEGQVDTMPQDLLDPSFRIPSKFDAVMMVHTIREWSPAHVQRFLHLICDALNPGGFVFMDMVSNREEGKEFEKLAKDDYETGRNALYFLVSASNEQYLHTTEQVESMLEKAGCQPSLTHGYVVGTKL